MLDLEETTGMRRGFSRDVFHSIASKDAAQTTIAALSAVQDRPAEQQVAGLAAAFLMICERVGMQPGDVFSAVANMMAHHERNGERTFAAAEYYFDNDVFVG